MILIVTHSAMTKIKCLNSYSICWTLFMLPLTCRSFIFECTNRSGVYSPYNIVSLLYHYNAGSGTRNRWKKNTPSSRGRSFPTPLNMRRSRLFNRVVILLNIYIEPLHHAGKRKKLRLKSEHVNHIHIQNKQAVWRCGDSHSDRKLEGTCSRTSWSGKVCLCSWDQWIIASKLTHE